MRGGTYCHTHTLTLTLTPTLSRFYQCKVPYHSIELCFGNTHTVVLYLAFMPRPHSHSRLLLSCLHAWNLDEALDRQCEEILGLVRPSKPVSFGLLSRGGCMSLVMPGFGVRSKPQRFDSVQLSGSGHETAR